MQRKNILSLLLFAVVVGGMIYSFLNMQAISDWLRLRNYDPPARIVKLADATTMNAQTRRLFYVNHPELGDKVSFNEHCRTTEQSIILGCYVENQGIFLLDVNDKRLNGVVEVTAAHEVLHAAYERLDRSEREKVDKMTSDYFAKIDNDRIKETIKNYNDRDPGVVPNELHSILGTEVRDLPPELEKYYAQYFKDRKKVVGFSEQYEQTFIDLKREREQYDKQIEELRSQIDEIEAEINSLNSRLQEGRAELDGLLSANQTQAYNDKVPEYNSMVNEFNRLLNLQKQLVDQHNGLVDTRNAIVTAEQALIDKIDSSKLEPEEKQ